MFYGAECPHCHAMMPLVDRLAKEEGIEVQKLEVWHDQKNAERMGEYWNEISEAAGGAPGVPAFVDTKKRRALCGEVSLTDNKRILPYATITVTCVQCHEKYRR